MNRPMILPAIALAALAALALAGTAAAEAPTASRPSALPPMPQPADNPTTPAKVTLGAKLFIDPRLSGTGTMACQGCHYHELGWTDAKVVSTKDNGKPNTRHTPSLYNVGYQTAFYWDGRAPTLEKQVLAAWKAQINGDPEVVTPKIAAIPAYAAAFQEVFGGPPTPDTIVAALAAYLRTTVSDNSPWDRYETGDQTAVSADAVAGYALFTGKAGCAACHALPFYGNSTFYNIGLEAGKADPDPGRFKVTENEADRSAFKTPSLRSVARGAPYFHDGSAATLEAAVRYMAGGGGADPKKSDLLKDQQLTDAEIGQLVAFLTALNSAEGWTAPTLP